MNGKNTCIGLPITIPFDCTPCFDFPVVCYARKLAAASEYVIADTRYTLFNGNARKFAAIVERIITYSGYAANDVRFTSP